MQTLRAILLLFAGLIGTALAIILFLGLLPLLALLARIASGLLAGGTLYLVALAVVDFITGWRLLELPAIMYVWAGSLAIAVSACFIVTWRRAITAFTLNYYGAAIGLCIMGIALGLVDWAAIDVQSLQQTLGVSFTNAMAALNLNINLITHLRSGVAIAMAVVVAISNHTAVTTAQRPARRLLFVEAVLDKIAPVVDTQVDQVQVTMQPAPQALLEAPHDPVNEKPIYQSQFASREAEIRAYLERDPEVSPEQVMQAIGCTLKMAQKWIEKARQS